tara:strand:- start:519 stop:809 length:291 start_codon:yes stop_codon:yes gene_type:complete
MLNNKKSQGMSIRVIIIAVIGLILAVIVVGLFTGKIDWYSSGAEEITTCDNSCKNIGYVRGISEGQEVCKTNGGSAIPGKYSGIGDGKVCCCFPNI